ncbi:hypothetical protein CDEST_09250 [Colletotrichum destructivum]|uniref:Uncharacterized protein n=1 Tax=Colletotrichum destructivum TaxID=34406 RepID=A0AAX4IMW1_9PEZI|nr:hypothetical protein CDEST_09250 [Colletotrichum destructivum]
MASSKITSANLLDSLKQQFSDFDKFQLNHKQEGFLQKNLDVLERKTTFQNTVSSSRYNKKRTILLDIYKTHGYEAFFLCVFGLAPSALEKSDAPSFISLFRAWWNEVTVPAEFTSFITQLKTEYHNKIRNLPPRNDDTSSLNHEPTHEPNHRTTRATTYEQSHNEGVGFQQSHCNIGIGKDSSSSSALAYPIEHSATGHRKRSHDEAFPNANYDDDDASTSGVNNGFLHPPVEGPMGGLVYKLTPMDGVKIIANGDIDIILTMPFSNAAPFVTMRISAGIARDLITKRPNIMYTISDPS